MSKKTKKPRPPVPSPKDPVPDEVKAAVQEVLDAPEPSTVVCTHGSDPKTCLTCLTPCACGHLCGDHFVTGACAEAHCRCKMFAEATT